ncbi:hypothetical protein P3T76_002115 [Phytophthora citrophthora]|uniref:RxLR effector protein n=1 Tax=Phytophthora citrophthora TaxID=4793 RepID=A0AAD9GXH8_9STRA|nr:hypothetical protein P3T76_002115 [Phytophthora citrophthora]
MKTTALLTVTTIMLAFASADTSPRQLRSTLLTTQDTDSYSGNRKLLTEGLVNGLLGGLNSLLNNLTPSTAPPTSATPQPDPDEIDILRSRRVS